MRSAFAILAMLSMAAEPCRITVVDAENGWPVPMVELTTTSYLRFITDNAGVVAFDAPEFLNRETWLAIKSHGYSVKADGFGYRGVKVTPTPGGQITIKVQREMIAKRVGRLTGAGLFAESQKLGEFKEWAESGLTGSDSVQAAVYLGKRFWLWGDTNLPNYPLGIYHVPAATSDMSFDGYEPPLKPKFDYFRDKKGKPTATATMPGPGPTWLFGLATVKDGNRERLVATYIKTKEYLKEYERGLCVWDDDAKQFRPLKTLWTAERKAAKPLSPSGHAVEWTDTNGKNWLLFCDPFPFLKCPADYASWQDPSSWEAVPLPKLSIVPHTGSIGWHVWRKKWVSIFVQKNGKRSSLGEVWYVEADSPFGPWSEPVQVLTHENYTFYNPKVHCGLEPKGSPMLLFEGTYTAEFANRAEPTPRYNYNQMLYRIDLDQPPFSKK